MNGSFLMSLFFFNGTERSDITVYGSTESGWRFSKIASRHCVFEGDVKLFNKAHSGEKLGLF